MRITLAALIGVVALVVPGTASALPGNDSFAFTSEDAALGKVTFKAVASLVGARDALPSDNEAIGLPTKVNG